MSIFFKGSKIKYLALNLLWLTAFGETPTHFHELDPHIVNANWSLTPIEEEITIRPIDFDINNNNVAQILTTLPGVGFQSRGSHSLEPNLHGFTGDRLSICFNGHPLPSAAPTRTASAINYFSAESINRIIINHSYPSVIDGPVKLGGRIDIGNKNLLVDSSRGSSFQIGLSGSHFGDRSGYLQYRNNSKNQKHQFGIQHMETKDYRSGNKDLVDSDSKSKSYYFSSAFKLNPIHSLTISGNYYDQILARNASLPLDSKDSTVWVCTIEHESDAGQWKWKNRFGYSEANIHLTAEDRIRPTAILSIQADSKTRAYSFGSHTHRNFESINVTAGADFYQKNRDSTRNRNLVSGHFSDHIWPELWSQDIGLFTEISAHHGSKWKWRGGIRVDQFKTGAKTTEDAVELPVAKGKTIRENYAAYNDLSSFAERTNEVLGAINTISVYEITDKMHWKTGINLTKSSVGSTERYRSFVNALGGNGKGGSAFEIGNPALKPEFKKEITTGIQLSKKKVFLNAELYYATVNDYSQRQIISTSSPVVFGYRGINAKFYGLQTEGTIYLTKSISIPASITVMKGENKNNGNDLVEIPPWKSSIGLLYQTKFWDGNLIGSINWNHIGSAENPSPALMPIYVNTEDFDLINLSVSCHWTSNTQLTVSLLNICNEQYYHYLTPPVSTGPKPSNGSLAAGDRIPGMGRTFRIAIKWKF